MCVSSGHHFSNLCFSSLHLRKRVRDVKGERFYSVSGAGCSITRQTQAVSPAADVDI
jgi:hypothetical protein